MKKITVSKSELQLVYSEKTAKEAAEHFGVCLQTFYNMLDSAGIERKRKNFKRGENISFVVVE